MKPLDPRLLKYSKSSRGFLFTLIIIAVLSATATITQAFLLTKVIVSLFQRHLYFSQNIIKVGSKVKTKTKLKIKYNKINSIKIRNELLIISIILIIIVIFIFNYYYYFFDILLIIINLI